MAKPRAPANLSFDQAFQELEATVRQLESGDLPLEQALALFERGQALAARCSELLEQAELRLRQLMPDESGGYVETDLPADEES